MRTCNVKGCNSVNDFKNTTLYHLPKNEEKKKQLLEFIGLENTDVPAQFVFICTQHFITLGFDRNQNEKIMPDDTEPCLDLFKTKKFSSSVRPETIESNKDLIQIKTKDKSINNEKSETISQSDLFPMQTPSEDYCIEDVKSEGTDDSNLYFIDIPNEEITYLSEKTKKTLSQSNLNQLQSPTEDFCIKYVKTKTLSQSNLNQLQSPTEDFCIKYVNPNTVGASNLDPLRTPTDDFCINNVKPEMFEYNFDQLQTPVEDFCINNVKPEIVYESNFDQLQTPVEDFCINNVTPKMSIKSNFDSLQTPKEEYCINNMKSKMLIESNFDPLQTPKEEYCINNMKSKMLIESNFDPLQTPKEEYCINNMKSETFNEPYLDVLHTQTEDFCIKNMQSDTSQSRSHPIYKPNEENAIDNAVKCEKLPSVNSLEGCVTHIIESKPLNLISLIYLATPDQICHLFDGQGGFPVERKTPKTEPSDILPNIQHNTMFTRLKTTFENQKRKMNELQTEVKRQKKTILDYQNIITNLKEDKRNITKSIRPI